MIAKFNTDVGIIQVDTDELTCHAVTSESVWYDWSEGYADKWEIPLSRTEEEEDEKFDPMMNYYYPLPDFEHSALGSQLLSEYEQTSAEIKARLDLAGSVTLVHLVESDQYALALRGGGMDLRWDICRGYILMGYLPPRHFVGLPDLAGMNLDAPKNAIVIEACRKSIQVLRGWLDADERELDLLVSKRH